MTLSKNNNFIKDVVHDEIIFDEKWIWELIATPEFVRLHKIKQLGVAIINFPGAVHTRYAHSLGCYEVIRKYIKQLSPNITKTELNTLYAAALLHDIGHGPHSHNFELYTGIKHEEMTKRIISDEKSNVYKVLKNNSIDPEEVISIIEKKHEHKYFNTLVSSQIDADRLDYLLRDSHFTGAIYGLVDIDLLIKWSILEKDDIVYDYKAISSIENFLISRYHMYVQVYEKPKILFYSQLIRKILNRLKILYRENKNLLIDKHNLYFLYQTWFLEESWSFNKFLLINDENFNLMIDSTKYENDSYLKEAYKQIESFRNDLYTIYDFNQLKYNDLKEQISKKSKNFELYLDVVEVDTKVIYNFDQDQILVFDRNKQNVTSIQNQSMIIANLNINKPKKLIIVRNRM